MMLHNVDDHMKVKLTHEIVDHNVLGSVPEIMSTTIEGLRATSISSPDVRATRLLTHLIAESPYLGAIINRHRNASFWEESEEGFTFDTQAGAWPLLAWSDSLHEEEVIFLLRMLREEGAIQLGDDLGIPEVVVLPKGYARFRGEASKQASDQAFVAMWFHPSMATAYEEGIEKAIREMGFRPLRIDQKEHVNKIDDEIIAEIKRSRFLVADFSCEPGKPRGGVYFEAGFAFALGKPVIWCCNEESLNDVHFDTRQFNHIVWSTPDELYRKLRTRIDAVLGVGPFSQ